MKVLNDHVPKLKIGSVDLMHFMVQRQHCHTDLIQCGQYDNRGKYTVPIYNCHRKEGILVIIGSCVSPNMAHGKC